MKSTNKCTGPFNIDTDMLVAVAESQVGYTEKNDTQYEDDDPTDATHAGSYNYSKYGRDIGCDRGGDDSPWCASFVSWCMDQTNPESSFKNSASTGDIMDEYKNVGAYNDNNHKTPPHAGDIVIFEQPGGKGGYHCHIGIVVAYDPETEIVYTVEGNTSGIKSSGGCVNYHNYNLEDAYAGGEDTRMYMQGFCLNGGTSYGTITDDMKKSYPTVTYN